MHSASTVLLQIPRVARCVSDCSGVFCLLALSIFAVLDMDALDILRLLPHGALRQEHKAEKRRQYSRGCSSTAKRLRAQALCFNRSGKARTRDHQMPILPTGIRSSKKPSKIAGKGKWKCATPEYICLMGETPPETPQRPCHQFTGGPHHTKEGARSCFLIW